MVCERISLCLGRKLFDPQKNQTTSRAREASLRSMHIVIPSVRDPTYATCAFPSRVSDDGTSIKVTFTMCSSPASEFCLTNQLNGFPKSSEFSMPDSAPVARTFMAAVSFALGSHGGKKKATMDPVPKVEIFFFILQTRLKIGGE
ncbi:uncharacterized protein LOC121341351 isoform X1 [Onychostruthus taczanowskii]|uniref:uncharacterized protein LOC121341351 isoform X1 n=1 Tax=Onychostruthus taczanowskii TaxID=356909 RepID=UPI001B80CE3A|nr:uncharacterized protein LOC121341351 isoform X1 [Onychostruthus taczanowskii]